MGDTEGVKRLQLRRSDRCATCEKELAAGVEALWHRGPRVVTCLGCVLESPSAQEVDLESAVPEEAVLEPPPLPEMESAPPPVDVGTPGASALREYERLRNKRKDHARQSLGVIGVGLAKLIDEPQSTRAWQRGGKAEVYAARRLEKHLAGSGVKLLHDRRVPGHGAANIDHVAVGPGGVTVIDSKRYKGKVRVERVGGLFSPRRDVLKISGRDQTKLVSGVEKQLQYILSSLRTADCDAVDLRGALCMTEVDGLPLIRSLSVRGVLVDGPKRAAALAKRPGELAPETVDKIWRHLAASFPTA
jgi:hypothetical protein